MTIKHRLDITAFADADRVEPRQDLASADDREPFAATL